VREYKTCTLQRRPNPNGPDRDSHFLRPRLKRSARYMGFGFFWACGSPSHQSRCPDKASFPRLCLLHKTGYSICGSIRVNGYAHYQAQKPKPAKAKNRRGISQRGHIHVSCKPPRNDRLSHRFNANYSESNCQIHRFDGKDRIFGTFGFMFPEFRERNLSWLNSSRAFPSAALVRRSATARAVL
jgi:hypothetical protein